MPVAPYALTRANPVPTSEPAGWLAPTHSFSSCKRSRQKLFVKGGKDVVEELVAAPRDPVSVVPDNHFHVEFA